MDMTYRLPRKSILSADRLVASKTDIINIKTPIAHGLIESITAVATTVVSVGKYASTAS